MLDAKITELKKQVVFYAVWVENMVKKAVEGLMEKDHYRLLEVIRQDEPKANSQEMELDQMCSNLIALHQPEAKLLRIILMALKINNDLERIGDHAVNIAQSGIFLIERPIRNSLALLADMAEKALSMFRDSIDSYVKEDDSLARSVCARDGIVDGLNERIREDFSNMIREEPSLISHSLHVIRIAQNLERVADLSTNISEDVLYMVKGEVIKHHIKDRDEGNR